MTRADEGRREAEDSVGLSRASYGEGLCLVQQIEDLADLDEQNQEVQKVKEVQVEECRGCWCCYGSEDDESQRGCHLWTASWKEGPESGRPELRMIWSRDPNSK
jgi:hypothetical protein